MATIGDNEFMEIIRKYRVINDKMTKEYENKEKKAMHGSR